ncbi:MAG: SoxR reducing system RseC family protein [Azoarcus sp.]|jgi:sigma-E factor negative regulatory protein RseC|nr:SoxR reducing system RseC family protein [Azoarcus sp.]
MQTNNMQTAPLQGTVLALHEGKVMVRLNAAPTGGCSACACGSACGIGRLVAVGKTNTANPINPGRSIQLNLDAPPGIRVGDRVSLIAPRASLPLLALLGYVFPAFAMLAGAALGESFYGSDGITALFSLSAFLLTLALVRFISTRRVGHSPNSCSLSLSLALLSNAESSHEH